MSDFDYQPESGNSGFTLKPNVLGSKFGEGYEQRLPNGINTKLKEWNLTFLRESSDILTINTFLELKGGVDSFTWTPEGFDEVTVICREWRFNYLSGDARSLSCSFEELPA